MHLLILAILIQTAAFAKTVNIGLVSNFSELSTVSFNPYGGFFRDGVMLALEESAPKLKDKHIEIKLTEFDYGADDLNVIKIAKDAAVSDVSAVIGYNYSSNALIAAPLHMKYKLPMLSPSASANRLGTFEKYVHLGSFSNEYMAKVLAQFAVKDLKAKRFISIPAGNCAYCMDLSLTFEKEVQKLGAVVIKTINVLQEDKAFTQVPDQVRGLDFDAVFIPNQELTSARIISAFINSGYSKSFLGADGWGNEGKEFFGVLKGKSFQGYSVTHWHPELQSQRSQEFVRKYKSKFKKVPNDSSVLAYDFMNFLIQGILQSKEHDRESLEREFSSIKMFNGVTGKYLYKAGKAPQKDIHILKAQENRFQVHKSISPIGDEF